MGRGLFRLILFCMCGIQLSLQAPLRLKEKTKKEEAIKIALESTDELLANPKMVEKIKSDLDLIRYSDPPLRNHIHQGKWRPGQLYIKEISKEQLDALHDSEFKPIKSISEKEPGTVHIVFAKPFHPEHLSELLKLRFGFDSYPVPPEGEESMKKREGGNGGGKKKDEIIYNHDLSTYYFNPVNGKNCKKGCKTQYAVSVFVDESEEDDWDRRAWQMNSL